MFIFTTEFSFLTFLFLVYWLSEFKKVLGNTVNDYLLNTNEKYKNKIQLKEIKVFFTHSSMKNRLCKYIKNEDDHEHLEKSLNYIFGFSDKKPVDTTTNICWNYVELVILTYVYPKTQYDPYPKEYKIQLQQDILIEKTPIFQSKKILYQEIDKALIIREEKLENKNNKIYTEDISEILKQFAGPYSDFYKSFNGISQNLNYILYDMELDYWNRIEITDTFNEKTIIDLKHTNIIDWNPEFSL